MFALRASTALAAASSLLVGALLHPADAAAQDPEPHRLGGAIDVPPPMDVPYRQIVDPARHVPGSISYGTTSTGHLINAAQLDDEGPYHFVLPEHLRRDTHYGTHEIVGLIQDAAERAFAVSGARVGVGNIANPGGGDLYWSRSHNNGRDADLAFFFVDENGNSVEPETLLTVRSNGLARDGSGRRFDVAAGWALVEALLTSEQTQVQWIFIYDPLKQMLLEHARSIGAPERVIALASDILHQPGDSAPHDDHFHLRIFCSRNDRLEGCTNWGPEWSHAQTFDSVVEARVEELARGLSDPDPNVGAECLGRINTLAGEGAVPQLMAALPHAEPAVQLAIMEVLAEHDLPGIAGAVVPLLESSPSADVRRQAAWLLGYVADPSAAGPLAAVVRRDGASMPDGTSVAYAAAHALRNVWNADSVPDLVAAIADPRPDVREAVANVLSRATGRDWTGDESDALSGPRLEELSAFWNAWWMTHGQETQSQWYAEAFREAGYPVQEWDTAPLATLVQALNDSRPYIRFIADRALIQRTDGWTPSEGWSMTQRWRYWADRLGLR